MSADIGANIIAGVALLVSIVSAVYAWKSAAEARVANQISIHEYQKHLYEAFVKLNDHLAKEKKKLELPMVSNFEPYARTAALYVDSYLAGEIVKFYEACLELVFLHENARDAQRTLHSLQDDLTVREGGEMDRHMEEIKSAHNIFDYLDGDLNRQEIKAVDLGVSVYMELMRRLKIV
ncbi:hypothetical protein D3C77_512130 [compost metagenome]